ncbi:MAG: hypothetical protein ACYTBZ_27080, partial [Planctomycetota bacterium]
MKNNQSNPRSLIQRPRRLRRSAYLFLFVFAAGGITAFGTESANIKLSVEQLTSGTKHHFFGYIGQCQTIPWNASGRYVLGLEIDRIDRLPTPEEFATVILVDTHHDNKIIRLD